MKRHVLTAFCALMLMSTPLLGTQSGPKTKSVKAPTAASVKTSKATKPPKSTAKAGSPDKPSKSAKAEVKGNKKMPSTTVQEKLKKNTNLAAKLEGRLPEGTDLMKAASGFDNLGQFVAAVNVSSNHENISFTELKALMVDEGYSLGQAMQKLKAADATTEARRAETEANRMIETSEREIAAPTGVSATKKSKKPVGAHQ